MEKDEELDNVSKQVLNRMNDIVTVNSDLKNEIHNTVNQNRKELEKTIYLSIHNLTSTIKKEGKQNRIHEVRRYVKEAVEPVLQVIEVLL